MTFALSSPKKSSRKSAISLNTSELEYLKVRTSFLGDYIQNYIHNYSESQIYRFLLQKAAHCNHFSSTTAVAIIFVLNCYRWHDVNGYGLCVNSCLKL